MWLSKTLTTHRFKALVTQKSYDQISYEFLLVWWYQPANYIPQLFNSGQTAGNFGGYEKWKVNFNRSKNWSIRKKIDQLLCELLAGIVFYANYFLSFSSRLVLKILEKNLSLRERLFFLQITAETARLRYSKKDHF